MLAYRSITKRWAVNSLGLIVLVLIIVEIVIGFGIKNYYYSSVKNKLMSSDHVNYSRINENANNSKVDFKLFIRDMVENFDSRDIIEMMAIDSQGDIFISSSGFDYKKSPYMKDYEDAISQSEPVSYYEGNNSYGEKIMSITRRITPFVTSECVAIRYVVSLEQIDKNIIFYMVVITGIIIIVLLLILLSNSYFIRSIVYPVRELGNVAREFATGNMDKRIIKKSDDEIGELCDIINYMADEIQKTEKMKNEFISSVSHELRTPLTAIRGWGETLASMMPEEDIMIQKGMGVIINETERLSSMVEELLDFSRIQNGKFTLVKTKMDLLAEVDDAVLMYTEKAKSDNKTLICNEPENVSYVFGDKNRLKQVFINIIDNAIKYSEEGGVITVDVKEKDSNIIIIVSDTGCGISSEDLPRIKEKFYKANSTKRGSGIGLAVANEIVNLHNGELLVESTINVGTTVTIKIPILEKNEIGKIKIQNQEDIEVE